MLKIKNLEIIFIKYFYRILLFCIIYHGIVRPLQINVADKMITPLIEKKIANKKNFELKTKRHHLTILHETNRERILHFSIPFGQAYFFLIFFLWFKPQSLLIALSIYNLCLLPVYTLSITLFLNGYFFLGDLVVLNEKYYRLIYGLIFLIRIINPKKFNLIFDSTKNVYLTS